MLSSFFAQPTWPVASATLVASIVTLTLQAILTRRARQVDEQLRIRTTLQGERNAETASSLNALKERELKNAATARWAEVIERRTDRLQENLAELLGLVVLLEQEPSEVGQETRARLLRLCSSISLSISPRGAFAEALNIQLGHLREVAILGPSYLKERPGLISSFQTNAWKIIDADRDRVTEALVEGQTIERRQLEPDRWRP